MHPPETRAAALALVEQGVNDCEISRRLGVSRTTIRDWRAPRYVPRTEAARATCPRCWQATKPMVFTPADYAFLLGIYLGDGCISRMGRTYRLRISLDVAYPEIIATTEATLRRCFPNASVNVHDRQTWVVVGVYSNHLPCLFPQHGPGKKHDRQIALETWQRAMVDEARWSFLRGLIWSDGSSFINRHGRYEDLCFEFSNLSSDLVHLCADVCDDLDVVYRFYAPRLAGGKWRSGRVRINRREQVARLVENVGVKR